MKKILGLGLVGLIFLGVADAQSLERDNLRAEVQREVRRDRQRSFHQENLASEGRNSDYELGKSVIDVLGRRVRIEEYILRPERNVFNYLLLNKRANRLDYLSRRHKFAKDLPLDLKEVTRDVWKPVDLDKDRNWDNWLIHFHQRASNTFDHVDWDLKAVPIGIENIKPDLSGRLNYIYTYSVGNREGMEHIKERWEIRPGGGGEHEYAGGEPPKRLWFHSPTVAYNAYGEVYAGVEIDGNSETDQKTFIGYEQFIIDDFGHIQSRSRGSSSDVSLTNEFPSDGTSDSPLNRELIITATEFNGRTIDLVKPIRGGIAIQLEPVKDATVKDAIATGLEDR